MRNQDPGTRSIVKGFQESVHGDTIVVQVKRHSETVRLIGVDTAETEYHREPVEYFGKEVSQIRASLLKGQQVRLEVQPVPTGRD